MCIRDSKWYAQMTGNKTPLTLENIGNPSAYGRLYGLTSVDDDAQMVYSLFGGQAGKQTVSIENLTSTKTFEGADMAHVKIYSTKYTGHHGFADEIPVEMCRRDRRNAVKGIFADTGSRIFPVIRTAGNGTYTGYHNEQQGGFYWCKTAVDKVP